MSHSDFNTLKVLIDASSERQQLLSSNLANIDTEGYIRQDIDFGTLLNTIQNEKLPNTTSNTLIGRARYLDHSAPVSLEGELSKLYDNHLRYVLLTKAISHHYEHLRKALEVRGQ